MENWRIVNERVIFLRQNLARADNRGDASHKITITLDELYSTGEAQKWRCALSGEELEFTRGGQEWGGKWCNPNSCTLDRIDSSKGYIPGNIQLLTWRVNYIKQHLDNQEFIDICKLVSKTRKTINNYT
jgi:hypothetical protein